jgi:hypothetical protein
VPKFPETKLLYDVIFVLLTSLKYLLSVVMLAESNIKLILGPPPFFPPSLNSSARLSNGSSVDASTKLGVVAVVGDAGGVNGGLVNVAMGVAVVAAGVTVRLNVGLADVAVVAAVDVAVVAAVDVAAVAAVVLGVTLIGTMPAKSYLSKTDSGSVVDDGSGIAAVDAAVDDAGALLGAPGITNVAGEVPLVIASSSQPGLLVAAVVGACALSGVLDEGRVESKGRTPGGPYRNGTGGPDMSVGGLDGLNPESGLWLTVGAGAGVNVGADVGINVGADELYFSTYLKSSSLDPDNSHLLSVT